MFDADDRHHARADQTWRALLAGGDELVCSNYVLVETFALVQHRLGLAAVRALSEDVTPVLTTAWVDAEIHAAAVAAVMSASRRKLSLVDCASFEVMRRRGLKQVFAFDPDFEEHGFTSVPKSS